MAHYIWTLLASLLGGYLQAAMGFGYGIVAISAFSLFFVSIPLAASTSMVVSLTGSTILAIPRLKSVQFKIILPLLIANVFTMPLSNYLSTRIPRAEISVILGIVLILCSIYYLFFSDKLRVRPTLPVAIAVGIVAGLLGGMFSVSGPPVALYLLAAIDDKEQYMASLQTYFALQNVYGLAVRTINGIMPAEVYLWAIAGIAGLLLGMFLGQKTYRKLDMRTMRKWVCGLIGISGVSMIAMNIGGIM